MRRSAAIDYRLGSLYALITAVLYAVQEPFSFLAAKKLSTIQFVCLTQIALLLSIPLLGLSSRSRRDLVALLAKPSNYVRLAVIFAIGISGLILYNFGLSDAHPIIISAILNLLPFWAALVALVIARVPIPISPGVFFGCFAGAFLGAMAVAWSQLSGTDQQSMHMLIESFVSGGWAYALPVPIFTALGGTLVGKWFGDYDEAAAIASNFLFANVLLIPSTLFFLYWRGELAFDGQILAIVLMIVGTIIAASVGRVVFQKALTATGGDNGFVSMFLNLVPALTALISFGLSWAIPALHFAFDGRFFVGLALIAVSLALFSFKPCREPARTRGDVSRAAPVPSPSPLPNLDDGSTRL
jgi:drug/metabolite transporter (DMT)-like permease